MHAKHGLHHRGTSPAPTVGQHWQGSGAKRPLKSQSKYQHSKLKLMHLAYGKIPQVHTQSTFILSLSSQQAWLVLYYPDRNRNTQLQWQKEAEVAERVSARWDQVHGKKQSPAPNLQSWELCGEQTSVPPEALSWPSVAWDEEPGSLKQGERLSTSSTYGSREVSKTCREILDEKKESKSRSFVS